MALRISRTVFSALSGMRLLACLIVAPQRGYDEPAILSYAISSFCPTSADGLQHSLTGKALGSEASLPAYSIGPHLRSTSWKPIATWIHVIHSRRSRKCAEFSL